ERKNAEIDKEQYFDLKLVKSFELVPGEDCVCMKFSEHLVKWPAFTLQLACLCNKPNVLSLFMVQLQDNPKKKSIQVELLKNVFIESNLGPLFSIYPTGLEFSFCNRYLWITGLVDTSFPTATSVPSRDQLQSQKTIQLQTQALVQSQSQSQSHDVDKKKVVPTKLTSLLEFSEVDSSESILTLDQEDHDIKSNDFPSFELLSFFFFFLEI
ncbi:hypothetical protein RFI_08519, partial [Reticulomyxa filosa]